MMPAGATLTGGAHMDRIYQRQRHIYDLTRKYYLLGRDVMIQNLAPLPGGKVLEVGCGTGRNLILAARMHPHARFFGLDISPAMLDTARTNVARAGLAHRIMLAEADATGFDSEALFGVRRFDRIFLSYTLSMIPDWRAALDQASRLLGRGGRLELLDFGQQERLPGAFRATLFAWLARFDVTPRADLEQALSALAGRQGLAMTWEPTLRGYAWSARLERRLP